MRIRSKFRAFLCVGVALSVCLPVLGANAPGEQRRRALELLASSTPAAAAGASAVARPDPVKRANFSTALLVSAAFSVDPDRAAGATLPARSRSAASRSLGAAPGRAPPLAIS